MRDYGVVVPCAEVIPTVGFAVCEADCENAGTGDFTYGITVMPPSLADTELSEQDAAAENR